MKKAKKMVDGESGRSPAKPKKKKVGRSACTGQNQKPTAEREKNLRVDEGVAPLRKKKAWVSCVWTTQV